MVISRLSGSGGNAAEPLGAGASPVAAGLGTLEAAGAETLAEAERFEAELGVGSAPELHPTTSKSVRCRHRIERDGSARSGMGPTRKRAPNAPEFAYRRRMRALAVVGLMGAAIVFFACGDDTETTDTGAGEGEPCEGGSDCQDGLMCFVAVDGEPGECLPIPAACDQEEAKCTSGCFDEFRSENCDGGSSCLGIGGSVTLTCTPP